MQTPEEYYSFDHDNYLPAPVRKRLQLLLSVNGDPAAAATLDILNRQQAALRGLAVSSDQRGRNLGSAFIAAVEELADDEGIELITVLANPGSAGFYLKCGFRYAAAANGTSPGTHVAFEKRIGPKRHYPCL